MKFNRLIFLILLFSGMPISAHPHIFIDLELELLLDENGIYGLREKWRILNEMGKQISNQYDIDENGILDSDESALLKNVILPALAANHFYTYFTLKNCFFYPEKAEQFTAGIEKDGTVSLNFVLPCRIESRKELRLPELVIYDPTRYLSFGLIYFNDNPVPELDYRLDIVRNGNVYSHGNKLGNAVLLFHLKQKTNKTDSNHGDSGLIRFFQTEITELEKRQNPFASAGMINDEKIMNPFMSQ